MTLTETINHYESLQHTYERNAISKTYYNPYAAETDRQTALEYKQLVGWLKELQAYQNADEEIRQLPQVWEEGAGITKCIIILNEHLREVTMNDNS